MTGVSKQFPGVKALERCRLPALPGRGPRAHGRERRRQVHPDQGADRRLRHRRGRRSRSTARRCAFASPLQAQQAGVSTVYQEVNLCPNLSVAENIFIGREPRQFGRIQWSEMRRRAASCWPRLRARHRRLRAAVRRTRSPSSRWWRSPAPSTSRPRCSSSTSRRPAWTPARSRSCSGSCASSRTTGIAILFVTHFLDQIYEISDRITVLRNGRLVGEYLDRATCPSSS